MNFDFSYVDIAFKNGKVITVNEKDDICEAVAIKGNKIVFVGSNEDLEKIIDDKTKVYDLNGRTLMPGMIDTHIHPFLIGLLGTDPDSPMISLFGDRIKSIADIKNEIKQNNNHLEEVELAKKLDAIKEYSVDRFEGEYAVLENRKTNEIKNVKKDMLPENIKEGSILQYINGKYTYNEELTKEETNKIRDKMNKLWN